jgi:hypothetical protein
LANQKEVREIKKRFKGMRGVMLSLLWIAGGYLFGAFCTVEWNPLLWGLNFKVLLGIYWFALTVIQLAWSFSKK